MSARFNGTLGARNFVFGDDAEEIENPGLRVEGDLIAEDFVLTDNPDDCDHFIDGVVAATGPQVSANS